MGTRLEAIATATSADGLTQKGGLALADEAAKQCLAAAGRDPNDLDLLVNAGLYHDRNLGEPALAALIQEDIAANVDPEHGGSHGTFSFDVANGGASFLTAAMLVDGFLRSGAIRLGMVVASDANPGHVTGFPYGRTGGAVLLSRHRTEGFSDFSLATFDEDRDAYESRLVWHPSESGWFSSKTGENALEFRIREDFTNRCVECALEATRAYLTARELRPADIDLIVPSPFPPHFPSRFAEALGVPMQKVATIADSPTAHTAGPVFALERAWQDKRFARAARTLFVSVGAGITVSLALYLR